MAEIRLIEIREEILSDNLQLAEEIRQNLLREGVFMLNLMASPGGGKTSLILETIHRLRDEFRIAVIEGDIDSTVDAEKVAALGIPAVQLRTGGACHLDAPMIRMALDGMELSAVDLLLIENVGNLVCPAEFDTGATIRAMILSVPEGDDKPLKYPLMFSVCDALVVNKIDYLPDPGFSMAALRERVLKLNPGIRIFEVSCRTGEGLDAWVCWLREQVGACRRT
ncbi:MAG: hydrogenase accessory protein HypB [Deltaproteobacteria bacterium HGW-Deltaproteobacteria-11]|nr:MAG: hydrogenase accessory protein HypB [Deltaproteobacteria bacterium HGW-Deltaproteobacteria-11]